MSSSLGIDRVFVSVTLAPHFMQNNASSGYSALQLGHFLSSFFPHFIQKIASDGFSYLQLGHFIAVYSIYYESFTYLAYQVCKS